MTALTFKNDQGAVLLNGSLNRSTVPAAWADRAAWCSDSELMTLDLAGVDSVDSAGLAMLIQLKAELQQRGQQLTLRNVNKQLIQFAEVSGVTGLLSVS
ncbi:MAG: STAS domain-containing protein [Idiomarina sp.]|nr:STAS domain-containing protein [Idiomarina sp.]